MFNTTQQLGLLGKGNLCLLAGLLAIVFIHNAFFSGPPFVAKVEVQA